MKKILSLMATLCMLMACMAVPMAVNADDTAVNYALATNGTTISYSYDNSAPSVLIDGSTETGDLWLRKGYSVTLTFKNFVQPSRINIYANDKSDTSYSIQGSLDGEYWFDLNASEANTVDSTYLSVTYSATQPFVKHIKIGNTRTDGNSTVYEIETYGTEATGIPYLESLGTETGKWTTDFVQSTTAYKVQLDSLDSLPELTYETLMPDAEVEYTPASADNNYTATITVSHDGETLTYTVQFILYNYALAANGTTIAATNTSSIDNVIDGDTSKNAEPYFRKESSITLTFENFVQPSEIVIYANNNGKEYYSISGSLDGNEWFALTASDDAKNQTNEGVKYLTLKYSDVLPFVKYIKLDSIKSNCIVYEIEVYGNRAEETYTANCVVSDSKVIGNVLFLNKTEAAEVDKFYLMAVYVDGELYEVIPVDKSSVPVAAGAAASTDFAMTRTLPEEGTVTARLFVWSNPTTIVPVTTTPLDVL